MHSILNNTEITRYSQLTLILGALTVVGQLKGQVELPASESEPEEEAGNNTLLRANPGTIWATSSG